MNDRITIGQLAQAAGVPTTTVRYYERRGLLLPERRSPHGYRLYGKHALTQLRFIRSVQASGFALDDIARLLALRANGGEDCEDVQRIIEQRLTRVRQELKQLQHVERVLGRALDECRSCSASAGCQTLNDLRDASTGRPASLKRRAGIQRGCRR